MSIQTIFWFLVLAVVVFLFAKNLRQACLVTGGHVIYELWNFSVDWILWPVVIAKNGFVGFMYLTAIAFIINLIVLCIYQKMKIDWLGVSILDEMKQKALKMSILSHNVNKWKRPFYILITATFKLSMWLMSFKTVVFIVLSCWEDSFVATAFLRKESFGPIGRRDLLVFTASTLFSCAFWGVITGSLILPSVTHVWSLF